MRNIVYLTDENYAMPTCVSITSLKQNNVSKEYYQVYILGKNISNDTYKKFLSLNDDYVTCSVLTLAENKYKELEKTCLSKEIHVTDTALYKFEIADLLSEIDEILYLDSDIIINKDISELFQIDISDVYVAATDDMGDEFTPDGKSQLAQRIGLTDRMYFNSGVMWLNLKKMRKDNIGAKLLEYRMEQQNFFMDQDAFNAVLGCKRKILPISYNFRGALFDTMLLEEINQRFGWDYNSIEECIGDQFILHMTDKRKPWEYNLPWLSDIFKKYYLSSPYREETLTLFSPIKPIYEQVINLHKSFEHIYSENQRKIWGVPFEKIRRGSKVVLYGAGDVGQDLYKQIVQTEYCELVLWTDKNWKSKGGQIQKPEEIRSVEYDYVIIAIARKDIILEVKEDLIAMGISNDRIIDLN